MNPSLSPKSNFSTRIATRRGTWPVLLLAGCCAVLTGLAQPVQAAVTEAWVHRYNNVVSNSVDQAVKVARDAADDIIVTGNTGGEMLTIKYSGVNGSLLWEKRGPDGGAQAVGLALDAKRKVVVIGTSSRGETGGYYTAKYASADGALLWEKRYNGPADGYDQATAVAVDGGGNVVITGTSGGGASNGDYYTAKYAAADGALLWEKRYNGPANLLDYATGVAVDGSGNVVVTGYSDVTTVHWGGDYYTAKYAAADGALLWERRYKQKPYDGTYIGGATAVAVDGNGNVIVTGSSNGDYYTAKYAAADGALLWEKRGPDGDARDGAARAAAVAVDGSGNVIVMGSSGWATYTAKYAAADGSLLWEKSGLDIGEQGASVAVDAKGNVVMAAGSNHYYTAKYSAADGALLWEKRYNGSGNYYDLAQAVAVDGSGNVVVTGFSIGNGTNPDYYTAKYAEADGALLWEQRYNGDPVNYEDQANAVAVDGSGNVVVTGFSIGNGTSTDYYTAKYAAADGALLWEKRYNGPLNYDDQAKAVAIDGSGNVIVTGYSDSGSREDYYTAKYAAANGVLLWEKRYDGPGHGNGDDRANAVAVDGNGNVAVTGSSANGINADYYTAKYAAADGALLWEQRYNAPANGNDRANAVAVDDSGNAVVTGSSQGVLYTAKYAAANGALLWDQRIYRGEAAAVAVDHSGNVMVAGSSWNGTNKYYYTGKYAAADGALLWERRYNGPGNGGDRANAVAVDDSGNAVVTGYSSNGANNDYYTAKYAAADGALLWEKRYNGPANSDDRPIAVAVDGPGNVVVTGSSDNGTSNDYYTAKYAAADGALLWEKRYHGGTARSLALGPNGMVVVAGSSGGDYATVVYRENLPPISIDLVPAGVRLSFTGTPGLSYKIERAPDVTGPWTTINTQTAPASGLLQYLAAPPLPGQAFYRTVQP